ncbi:cysteine protease [Recurvomyces mirabilis]|nr:cysteine protease [Recurvomyces mirabilis]
MSNAGHGLDELLPAAEQPSPKPPRSSSRDVALQRAIAEAEAAMRALKLAKDPNEQARQSTRFKQLLQEAERIKHDKNWRLPSSGTNTPTDSSHSEAVTQELRQPESTRVVPRAEQILLLKAGYLNGFKFPPWSTPPAPNEFELKDGQGLFVDTPELPLSEFQEDVLDDWKRPSEAMPPPTWFPGDRTNLGPSMSFARKIDLVQDAATDCSVVASLCAGVARAEHGYGKILGTVIYPYDREKARPAIAANGKYVVRLNFNGCSRKVVIDDRLPVSSTGRIIHVIDRRNPGLLWPALIEKAYLKVRGGYDFPGSNSATDLWILTGWIPEQVFLQSDELEPNEFWSRIYTAFNHGDVLITMGTGKMTAKTERELGLAGEHDYAVLDLREVDGQRLLLIKNPWCEGTSWRGKLNDSQRSDIAPTEERAEQSLIQLDDGIGPLQSSRDLLNADEQLSPGTFWMDLDNVMQHYESIYLNWNPALFTHRADVHFAWDLTSPRSSSKTPRGQSASLSSHPQYSITPSKSGIVWILLWRHFKNSIPDDATDEQIEEGRYSIDLQGHISLMAFSSGGLRMLLPEKHIEKGWYVDSPQTLLKLKDCKPEVPLTIVPLEQDLASVEHTFTLSVFSHSPVEITPASVRYPYALTLASAWTIDTAGGNAHSPVYSTNPQFAIAVSRKTSISLLLEVTQGDLNVHVKLVHSRGQRVYGIRSKDIVFDSNEYRRGCCVSEGQDLEPGQYTIICSTFEQSQLGTFTLTAESSQPTQMLLLPREGAGRIRLELSTVAFSQGQVMVAARIVAKRLARFYAVVKPLDTAARRGTSSANRSLIRMSIESGRGPHRHIYIASNGGEYADCGSGVRMEDIDLRPELTQQGDGLWLVLDRRYVSAEAQEERFTVELHVDQPDVVACGVWRAWEE